MLNIYHVIFYHKCTGKSGRAVVCASSITEAEKLTQNAVDYPIDNEMHIIKQICNVPKVLHISHPEGYEEC